MASRRNELSEYGVLCGVQLDRAGRTSERTRPAREKAYERRGGRVRGKEIFERSGPLGSAPLSEGLLTGGDDHLVAGLRHAATIEQVAELIRTRSTWGGKQ